MKRNVFSKLNTKTKLLKKNKKLFFDKQFKINIKLMRNTKVINKIIRLIKVYYQNIYRAKINIPVVKSLKKNSNKIFCRMEYQGKNLVQKGFTFSNKDFFLKYIDEIIEILLKAKNKKIMIDPHIKNFVVNDGGKVFYVDIFPPYSNKYNLLRKLYYQPKEKKILDNNFVFFQPKNLFYHFISDIIKLDRRNINNLDFYYQILKKKKVIFSKKKNFKKKVFNIMEVELERERKKFYLI